MCTLSYLALCACCTHASEAKHVTETNYFPQCNSWNISEPKLSLNSDVLSRRIHMSGSQKESQVIRTVYVGKLKWPGNTCMCTQYYRYTAGSGGEGRHSMSRSHPNNSQSTCTCLVTESVWECNGAHCSTRIEACHRDYTRGRMRYCMTCAYKHAGLNQNLHKVLPPNREQHH